MNTLQLNQNNLSVVTQSPEETFVWNYVLSQRAINGIVPLVYQGAILASEFTTYNANKLYLALSVNISASTANAGAVSACSFYNVANALCFYLVSNQPVWNGAALQYGTVNAKKKFFIFSRLGNATFVNINFIGYRLTIS